MVPDVAGINSNRGVANIPVSMPLFTIPFSLGNRVEAFNVKIFRQPGFPPEGLPADLGARRPFLEVQNGIRVVAVVGVDPDRARYRNPRR